MAKKQTPEEKEALDRERGEVLQQVEEILELPVLILGFIWLVLLVIEFIWGLGPILEALFFIIWGIFIIDFALRFTLAPKKVAFVRRNWLTAISLTIPAMRVFQLPKVIHLLRLARTTRGIQLVRVVGTFNRGMRALRASMGRRGFGYVVLLTIIVALLGSAGMFFFEGDLPGFDTYGDTLWWTLMIITTLGSGEWPQTAEGRILTFLLSLYAFAIFGYATATLATFFIGQEAESEEAEIIGVKTIRELREEIRELRDELRSVNQKDEAG
jgi:voltage-gated potassium channel